MFPFLFLNIYLLQILSRQRWILHLSPLRVSKAWSNQEYLHFILVGRLSIHRYQQTVRLSMTVCWYPSILLGGEKCSENKVFSPRTKYNHPKGQILDLLVQSVVHYWLDYWFAHYFRSFIKIEQRMVARKRKGKISVLPGVQVFTKYAPLMINNKNLGGLMVICLYHNLCPKS